MPLISDLLNEIRRAQITINIINDSRGVSPGGTMILDLVRGNRCFATLLIRTLHPVAKEQFNAVDNYSVTEVSIDNAEVLQIRRPVTAQELWTKLDTLLRERHIRAKEALSRLPRSNTPSHRYSERAERSQQPHSSQPGCYQPPPYSPRYKHRHRRRFPAHFYRTAA